MHDSNTVSMSRMCDNMCCCLLFACIFCKYGLLQQLSFLYTVFCWNTLPFISSLSNTSSTSDNQTNLKLNILSLKHVIKICLQRKRNLALSSPPVPKKTICDYCRQLSEELISSPFSKAGWFKISAPSLAVVIMAPCIKMSL